LVLSPWALQYGPWPPIVNATIVGALICVAGVWAASSPPDVTSPSWANAVFGLWLMVAPWVVGYRVLTEALANDTAIGLGVLVLASIRIATARAVAGGAPSPRRIR
jgi:hypothetical protein